MSFSTELDRITNPLRLATGSHEPGSGRGCALNLISWIRGDIDITDFPDCTAGPLARMVQVVNDELGKARGDMFRAPLPGKCGYNLPDGRYHYLTPEDSLAVLDLAWSTVGTAGADAVTVAAWQVQVMSNTLAVLDEAKILADAPLEDAFLSADYAVGLGRDGEYVSFGMEVTTAVRLAVGLAGMVAFVQDCVNLWKELNEVEDIAADPAVVNEAIDRMVTV